MWIALVLSGVLGAVRGPGSPPPPRVAVDGAAASRPRPPAPAAEPTRAPSSYALRRGEGRGLVIAGGVLAGLSHVWIAAAEVAAAPSFAYQLRVCTPASSAYDPDACSESWDVWWLMVTFVRPPAMAVRLLGVSLLGAGLSRHGSAVRRRGLAGIRGEQRRLRVRRDVGLALLSSGALIAALNVSLVLVLPCERARNLSACRHGVYDSMLVASSALIGAGLSLGPYADGYLREDRRLRGLRVAPMGVAGGMGLSVGGRF